MQRRAFLQRTGITLGFVALPGGLLRVVDAHACGEAGDVDFNAWVHISNSENTISVKCPVVEMGQGIYTALPLLIAEELDADWRTLRVEQASSDKAFANPDAQNRQGAGGSRASQGYWRIARLAGAQARAILIANAARVWNVAAGECTTEPNNVVHAASGRKLSYMEIARLEDIRLDAPPRGVNDLKPSAQWRLAGRDVPRADVQAKVTGRARYGIDVQIPGMLYASILHSPNDTGPITIDSAAALRIEGVTRVIELPQGVAVVGADYWATVLGKRALNVQWKQAVPAAPYDSEAVKRAWATVAADNQRAGRVIAGSGNVDEAFRNAAQTVSADYVSDHAHAACMEPFNATASMMHDDMELWSSTQSQTSAQQACAAVTGLAEDKIRVFTPFAGGGFGARTEQRVNAEAAMLSKIMDKPVKVMWSREDDMQNGACRPLAAQHLEAAISAEGRITGWRHRVVADSVLARVRKAAWAQDPGFDEAVAAGMTQPYGIAHKRHEFIHQAGGVPVGYWNAVGSGYTVFAVESFIDEVAAKIGKDPLQLRLELLAGTPGLALLERVRKLSDWDRRLVNASEGTALGVAYNHGGQGRCQAAAVVEVSVIRAQGAIKVHNVWAVVDAGTAIHPRHLRQQIETGAVRGLSAALRERITVREGRVQQSNFADYAVLRMDEAPPIHVELMPGGDGPLPGAGQISVGLMAPAIANAVHRLTGARLRAMPMLPEQVTHALMGLSKGMA